ncbi:MAG: hypothetical protein HN778_09850 [Prolixibacteraceae bacterium]|jgi:hypothetical protein|nr:hypothetical protein [Prolixibacteraceae bacterium]MBT6007326.1 hypothetical protein [Prolixibacteraceae bacterium]MBT6766468.1 hypothetical protein [Prolixibacteraceae bacterium]MBT7000256.1 hypothetical protein [Prolixibacteraceae bacterium]MBT7395123.1 hypothetical protein [Prolixibacteraceae bacterium]
MKKITFISLVLFLFTFTVQSQKIYSVENLEQASQEELDIYLEKALKNKKTGKTLTNVGLITLGADALFVTGIIVADKADMGTALLAGLTMYAALGTIAVGIPMKITGKKRVERINTIKNTASNGIKIDLKPSAQYNLASQNYQPELTLRIRF